MKEHLNAIIIAVALLLAVTIYCFGTRYQVTNLHFAGMLSKAIEYDRITGEIWGVYIMENSIIPLRVLGAKDVSIDKAVEIERK